MSDHPMGLNATVNCGGTSGWDCTEANGIISMRGSASSRFVTSYGFFVKPGVYNNKAVVVCTTCHEPHSMNVVTDRPQLEFRAAGGNLHDHVLPARALQSKRH